jgi:S1-C subfamily serine protease
MHVLIAAVVAMLFFQTATAARAQTPVSDGQKLAMTSKPAVVQVIEGCSGTYTWNQQAHRAGALWSGSGFFVNPDGYIVTNAHVVSLTQAGPAACERALFNRFVGILAQANRWNPQALTQEDVAKIRQSSQLSDFRITKLVGLSNGTFVPFEIKSFGDTGGTNLSGKDVAVIKVEVRNAPVLKLANSDEVQTFDQVSVAGFPGAANLANASGQSRVEPSFTDGKISAKKSFNDGSPVLQISAPATHGNSGGPVLNSRGAVIGIVLGGAEAGFTFIVPSNTIMQFVRQAGTTNEVGTTNQAYRDALELYWQARYTQAIARFEEVRRLFPSHAGIDELIRDSQEKKNAGLEAPEPAPAAPQTAESSSPAGEGGIDSDLLLVALGATAGAAYLLKGTGLGKRLIRNPAA